MTQENEPDGTVAFTDAVERNPKGVFSTETLPIHVPADEAEDRKVEVRWSKIQRCRLLADRIKSDSVDWFSIGIGIGSVGIGGFLGGIVSALTLPTVKGALYYIICTAFTAVGGTLVAAVWTFRGRSHADLADEILRTLPGETQQKMTR